MFEFVLLLTTAAVALGGVLPPGLETQLEGRIVKGEPTSITSFPYQISLQIRGHHSCGGSIISKDIILTAAHCVYHSDPKDYKVRAGTSQWTSGGVLIPVKSFKVHERYNPILTINDIALIRLSSSLVFSSTIRPINLAKDEPESGIIGVVSGWGTTKFLSPTIPTQLKYVELPILSSKDCASKPYKYGMRINRGMICTYEPSKEACQGDSGGPLVHNSTLVGVVSWGMDCGLEYYPGVYTNVAHMIDWIAKWKPVLEQEA